MGRTPLNGGTAFRFLPTEVVDMENALDASSGATPARVVVEALALKFTNSTERIGQKPVQWKQVWNWFQNRRHAQRAKIAKTPDKLKTVGSGAETPPAGKAVAAAAPAAVPQSTGKKPSDVPMDFEAKSARDGAWYDVSAFISKRTGDNGVPEVRVRFAGFGSEEDEWVNIATAVRQRSLPCEATECVAVLPGDLILCFQEGNEQALYFDADILDVQRRRHDVRGCRCRFWVRYRHDQTEEVVPLRKVCRRPETEQRLQQAKESGASSSKVSNKASAIEASTRALNAAPVSSAQPQIPATPATPVTPAQPSATPNTAHLASAGSQFFTPVQPSTNPQGPISIPPTTPSEASASVQQFTTPQGPFVHPISILQGSTPAVPATSSQGPAPIQPFAPPSSAAASAQPSQVLGAPASAQLSATPSTAGMETRTPAQLMDTSSDVAAISVADAIGVPLSAEVGSVLIQPALVSSTPGSVPADGSAA